MAVAVVCSGLKSAPTGPDEALDLAVPFTFWTEETGTQCSLTQHGKYLTAEGKNQK